jgi:hypothetical protein
MKEAPVHSIAVDLAQRTAIRKRKDGFRAELRRRSLQFGGNFIQRFVPGDTLESPRTGTALGRNPSHGMQQAIRRVHAIQVFGYFAAEKSASDRMIRVPRHASSPSILNRNQDGTGIGAVVRAGGVNNAGHAGL